MSLFCGTSSEFHVLYPQTQPAVVGASGGLVTAASLPALQHGLAHFHDSVCALVQHYLAASTQVTGRGGGSYVYEIF